MRRWHVRLPATQASLGVLTLALAVVVVAPARAQEPDVDPRAMELLRAATEYLGDLQRFSVQAHNFREDLLESGHRVDTEYVGNVTVRRPNQLRAERQDGEAPQVLYYDGVTLTLYNPRDLVYGAAPMQGTIEEMFVFAQDALGLDIPVTDLLRRDVFPLLVQDVTLAVVIGKEELRGVATDHLLFSRPGVDFQIWVSDGGSPLPLKFVVTDTGTPEMLSIVTLLSDWNTEATVPDDFFTFVPPAAAMPIPFLRFDGSR